MRIALWLLAGLLLLAKTGCDTGNGRLGIEGTVTLDNNPLHDGAVSFLPMNGTSSPTAGGEISNGIFSVKPDKGVMAGSYRVEIIATRKTGKQVMDPLMGTMVDEVIQYVPKKYNHESELTREVTSDGPNEFEFQLTSE